MNVLVVGVYIVQLLVFLVELGEGDPEGVGLPRGLQGVHSLHRLRVRVDDLSTTRKCTMCS